MLDALMSVRRAVGFMKDLADALGGGKSRRGAGQVALGGLASILTEENAAHEQS